MVDIYPLGRECELNQPYVRTFDAWGNRTDELGEEMETIYIENFLIPLSFTKFPLFKLYCSFCQVIMKFLLLLVV